MSCRIMYFLFSNKELFFLFKLLECWMRNTEPTRDANQHFDKLNEEIFLFECCAVSPLTSWRIDSNPSNVRDIASSLISPVNWSITDRR